MPEKLPTTTDSFPLRTNNHRRLPTSRLAIRTQAGGAGARGWKQPSIADQAVEYAPHMDVSYAVVAEFDADHVHSGQQIAITDLLQRAEVVQVVWSKRAEPQPRPARPRQVLTLMVLLDQTASEQNADDVSQVLSGLGVTAARVERAGLPHQPIRVVTASPPIGSRRANPADG